MEKEFIPYEQALALKELGFDELCFGFYENKMLKPTSYVSDFKNGTNHNVDFDNVFKLIPAPLYQQAFRWFREKYSLCVVIDEDIRPQIKTKGIVGVSSTLLFEYFKNRKYSGFNYEEAELECLKKLIEIVKEK